MRGQSQDNHDIIFQPQSALSSSTMTDATTSPHNYKSNYSHVVDDTNSHSNTDCCLPCGCHCRHHCQHDHHQQEENTQRDRSNNSSIITPSSSASIPSVRPIFWQRASCTIAIIIAMMVIIVTTNCTSTWITDNVVNFSSIPLFEEETTTTTLSWSTTRSTQPATSITAMATTRDGHPPDWNISTVFPNDNYHYDEDKTTGMNKNHSDTNTNTNDNETSSNNRYYQNQKQQNQKQHTTTNLTSTSLSSTITSVWHMNNNSMTTIPTRSSPSTISKPSNNEGGLINNSTSTDTTTCHRKLQQNGHLAHAVTTGPYYGVDTTNTNKGTIRIDGSLSHTHGIGSYISKYVWKEGSKTISTSETDLIHLSVGVHRVSLIVTDNAGNTDTERTTITIFPYGYPSISSVYPDTGSTIGGTLVTITGSGFQTTDESLRIKFGRISADRRKINIISNTKLEVTIPPSSVKVPVDIVIETSTGTSNGMKFTYIDGSPIAFTSDQLKDFKIGLPTVLTFDNNSILYVGTADGKIARLRLSDDFTTVVGSVVSNILRGRTILGIAADPMGAQDSPAIYVSHSTLFHGESKSTSGLAINGKVSRIEGANMDVVVDIITNLPVSDYDHSVNGIEFGDNGELYIQVGGNTNAGVPGELSGSHKQKENPLSGATLVADLADPNFDGNIQYDALDDGKVISKNGVQVFASGQRNSFDITLHSNGNLYATDNGPNNGYGKRAIGCGSQQVDDDPDEMDKLNLILEKRYYGHPNRNRGERDRKQCFWRSINSPSNADYKGPMMSLQSSTNGIIEFQTNHFEGQLRHDLIVSKYKDGLFRIILSQDGKSVAPESNPPIPLVGDNTLSVTQAPDGTLIDTRYLTNQIFFHKPIQVTPMPDLLVYGVYPRRGGRAGGYIISIYGFNFQRGAPLVMIGERRCPILTVKPKRITCRVYGGTGSVDVFVKIGRQKVTLKRGFRYIRGY